MLIRRIKKEDNKEIEKIIRDVLTEFGGNREGLAWADPELSYLSEVYKKEITAYWVAEKDGKLVGGCGIGPVEGAEGVCELQKMYFLEESRGTGVAGQMIEKALDFASNYYDKCYLETLSNMKAANRFYQKHGFHKLDKPILDSEHYACDVWCIKDLK